MLKSGQAMNGFRLASGGNILGFVARAPVFAGSSGIASTGAGMSTLGKCDGTGNVGGGTDRLCTACTLPGSAG